MEGILAFLPFEALRGADGRYLIESTDVSYAMSLSSWLALSERPKAVGKKLLLVGGAPYQLEAGATRGAAGQHADDAALLDKAARVEAALAKPGSLKPIYDELGYGEWTDLPGTLAEVTALSKANLGSTLLSGARASEASLKQLGAKLAQFGRVHFATHAFAIPAYPELSALVLAQTNTGKEDGFLRVGELAGLGFSAEAITLSACETGLGKIFRGEGVYGLAQPLLEKSARRVIVSLWTVPDEATFKLMLGLYEKADELGEANALAAIKRKFVAGEMGPAWRHPYYWASFVHYGP